MENVRMIVSDKIAKYMTAHKKGLRDTHDTIIAFSAYMSALIDLGCYTNEQASVICESFNKEILEREKKFSVNA